MQWLAALCVRRPVFTWVLILALVVVGTSSVLGLATDRFPNIDIPVVVVTTVLQGASPEQVETEVSDKLEEQLNTISGLDTLRSTSYEGLSVIVAQFDLDKDISVAAQEVRDRVNRTITQLPQGIDQPRVERVDPGAVPVMQVALSGPRSTQELTEYARRVVRRRIESLSGVGGVTVLGGRQRQVNIDVDPARLQTYGLSVVDVQRALASQNVEVPGGRVDQGERVVQLRVRGRIENVADFGQLTVSTRNGLIVRVNDIGSVTDGEENPASMATLNGRDVVVLSVTKQSGTNTVAVVDGLRERIAEVQRQLPPNFRLQIVRDESEFVRNAIHAVEEHLVLGSLFAALVVLIFLWNGRSTLIASLAIPTSIISTFTLIKAMGLTLNTITLLGLTLAVGIVIDDAIVVLENIVRFIDEKGMEPRRAAVLATKEIGLAVLATTLSLVAVFLPVAFMGGIVGRFMASFGFTMSFSIMVSLLVSFTLTPMLSSRWLKASGKAHPAGYAEAVDAAHSVSVEKDDLEFADPKAESRAEERAAYREWHRGERVLPPEFAHGAHGESKGLYGVIERAYMTALGFVMSYRWTVFIAVVVTMGSCFPLAKAVQKNFLPLDDESRFELNVRSAEGTSLFQMQVNSERIAREIRKLPGVQNTVVTVGSPAGDPSGRGPNQASIYVSLIDPTLRRHNTQQDVMGAVRTVVLPKFAELHLRAIVSPINTFGGGSAADSAGIQYIVRGPEFDKLTEYSNRLLEVLKHTPGVVDADSTLVVGNPEYQVEINRQRAADLGVSVSDAANALRLLVGDVEVTTYNEGGEQYEVHLRGTQDYRSNPALLQTITVGTATGRTVRLSDVTSVHEATGPSSILRIARQRQVTVYANVAPGTSEKSITDRLEQARAELNMLPGYGGELAGRSKELGKAGKSFAFAFVLSLVFMYLVLAAQFESWIHPVTILISLPLTVPFALFSLVALGQSMNIFSTLGILVLFGIVKKNSILQVDHMRDLRRRGLGRADAVMIGNRDRLRPILMTTVAFVAGMIPLVVSSGAGSGTNRAMGSVIIGGQTLSLLLTLLATPVTYSFFDDIAHSDTLKRIAHAMLWPVRQIDRLFGSAPADTGTEDPAE